MDATEQAADQIMRLTLSGTEMTLRLSGAMAKNVAAFLYQSTTSVEKTKGKTRLAAMLKSGKALEVFQIGSNDLERFAREAKRYGILYVVVKPTDGEKQDESAKIDIMVKADDAAKLNRILDKLEIGTVDVGKVAKVASEIEAERSSKAPEEKSKDVQHKDSNEQAIDELLGGSSNKQSRQPDDPLAQAPDQRTRSETTSGKRPPSKEASSDRARTQDARRSVKADIDSIKRERAAAEASKPAPEPPVSQTIKRNERPTSNRPIRKGR